jgi:hypothetical protein
MENYEYNIQLRYRVILYRPLELDLISVKTLTTGESLIWVKKLNQS